ncbi:MAG: NAD-dependent epimerase/dehydratase family protein [Pedobacter sp.]|nr:MAG: NAD-dependent epimerase/dehydratase family protein [Pedobacter sp.]
MATILVTGAAGFIGSHVVDELIALNHFVIAIDDLSGGVIENVNTAATFIKADIQDTEKINQLFEDYPIEYIYHLAAYAAEGLSHFIRRYNYNNNLIGSMNLINAAIKHQVKCFVFTSSIAVYGKGQLPFTEVTVPEPEDPYGIAKYAVELDLKAAYEQFGLSYIIFRPHNVYGERQNIGDKYRNVVGIFMNNILKGEALPIFGDGLQTRLFTYIKDVVPIIAQSALMPQTYNQVYNIGSDQVCSVKELAAIVSRNFNASTQLEFNEARNEVVHAQAAHDKAKQTFGHLIENTPLEIGIANMADWVKLHGTKPTNKFNAIEIERNLPESWK